MRRRELIALLGAAAVRPLAAWAQQSPMPIVGYLGSGAARPDSPFMAALRRGLSDAGYVAGKSVAIEYRSAEGHYDRLPALAADLVRRSANVIITTGGAGSARAARKATSAIPIVFLTGADPVRDELVASLAWPGGDLTGFIMPLVDLGPKRLELLSELVPQAKVIALLVNPAAPAPAYPLRQAARAKRVRLQILRAGTETQIDAAFASLVRSHADALMVQPNQYLNSRSTQIVALAARYAVPAIYPLRDYTAAAGLISYGPNLNAAARQLGIYAGRILKGAKPADLPVQELDKFELVINLKTARSLGLAVPQVLLALADEVIE